MRRGFTLIEMLVASGIFLFGFMAVYSMFLVGIRNRSLADATTRGATVASSVIAEIRLRATNEISTPGSSSDWAIPGNYVGDGNPVLGTATQEQQASPFSDEACFFPHPDQPGMYYRVISATDLQGQNQPSDGIVLTLLVGQLDSAEPVLPLSKLRTRYRIAKGDPPAGEEEENQKMLDHLVDRGTFQRYDAVIHRQVAWQR